MNEGLEYFWLFIFFGAISASMFYEMFFWAGFRVRVEEKLNGNYFFNDYFEEHWGRNVVATVVYILTAMILAILAMYALFMFLYALLSCRCSC